MPRMPDRLGGRGKKPGPVSRLEHWPLRRPIASPALLDTPARRHVLETSFVLCWGRCRPASGCRWTIITVQDLENLEQSIGHFSLADLLASHARDAPTACARSLASSPLRMLAFLWSRLSLPIAIVRRAHGIYPSPHGVRLL